MMKLKNKMGQRKKKEREEVRSYIIFVYIYAQYNSYQKILNI